MRREVLVLAALTLFSCGDDAMTPTETIAGVWIECAPPDDACTVPPASCAIRRNATLFDGQGAWHKVELETEPDANGTFSYCVEATSGVLTYDGTVLHTVSDATDGGPQDVVQDRRADLTGDYFTIYDDATTTQCEAVHRRVPAVSTGDCD